MIGTNVSHYEIREKIGAGGMGVVYKAWDTRLDRWVALKFLPQHADDDPIARERFIREAKAASALEHPHICTIHEIGETDHGQLFICMAFYSGPNLKQVIRSGNLTTTRAIELARQISSGLSRAHEEGIVHRDLKPSNIMLTAQGDVAIVDFGLAKLAGEISITRTGATLGTAAYMSPEQVRGVELDFRTDLWSMGVIVYQLLSGEYPFKGDYERAVQRSILEDEPTPLSGLNPELPEHIDLVIAKLLAKDRNQRFTSAGEVEQAFRALAQPMGSEMPTQAVAPPTLSGTGRSRRAWKPLAVAAALAVAITVWLQWPTAPAAIASSLAVMPYSNYTGDDSKSYLSDGVAAGLINSLSEIRGLTVLSRSEAWEYRDRGWGARKLGNRLGVETLLEGSVNGRTEGIAVISNLIDASSGRVLWTHEVRGPVTELLPMTGEIAEELTKVLSVRLTDQERNRLTRDLTRSFEAYEHYLRGQEYLADRHDSENLDAALELFKQSVRVDPEFALAHAALSEAHWEIWRRDGNPLALGAAEEEADTALDLDPELPAALVAKARVQRSGGRYTDSIAALEDALANHPHPGSAHRELALSYERAGDLESAEAALRAATVVEGDEWWNWNGLGALLWLAGKHDEARAAFTQAIELAPPEITTPTQNLAANELSAGNTEASIELYETIPEDKFVPSIASNLGTAYYFSDRENKWEKVQKYYQMAVRMSPRDERIRRNLADLYLELGETEKARAQYLEAMRLVEEKLVGDPENWSLGLQQALYAARASDCDNALELIGDLASQLPETGPNAQQTAYIYALCGLRTEALRALAQAVERGVAPQILRQEPEFESLREEPDFRALTESAR